MSDVTQLGLASTATLAPEAPGRELADTFQRIRRESESLCAPLALEDYGLQAMADTSPPKWHLAHTTWFFETFVLKTFQSGYQNFHPQFEVLFNSYYNGIGEQYPRPRRGLLSRPTVAQVLDYRRSVDEKIAALLANPDHPDYLEIITRVGLGLHHEQQHQELFFTDLKYSFAQNPLYPVYREAPLAQQENSPSLNWHAYDGGLREIGTSTPQPDMSRGNDSYSSFCFDNETPRHRVFVEPFALANRPVTNGEWLAFMADGGYRQPGLWLSDGWNTVRQQQWQSPLYWVQQDGHWFEYTLHGLQPLDLHRPVCHISAYEADAFARWAGARLPTEFEWESVASEQPVTGHFGYAGELHPRSHGGSGIQQLFGDVWEWTSSAYASYPGFSAAAGAIGEYNGKFMCNQLVLRGGSCVSSQEHLRATYRNFFYPADRWQFSGLRLAKSRAS